MITTTLAPPGATFEDLMRFDGKAELVRGRVVKEMPTGTRHNYIGGLIFVALHLYSRSHPGSLAFTDDATFRVPELSSGRESFSPDAAFAIGPIDPQDPGVVDGPPTFAVEVRSPEQHGRVEELRMSEKRADYFEAGTLAVWDVDPEGEYVTLHRPKQPALTFRRGEVTHAEPAVAGWSMTVDEILG